MFFDKLTLLGFSLFRYATLQKPFFKGAVTVGAVEVDGIIYLTTNGGASINLRNEVSAFAEANGYQYLDNNLTAEIIQENGLPGNHAEPMLYHTFPNNDVIGISHYGGACPGQCEPFFSGLPIEITWDDTYLP